LRQGVNGPLALRQQVDQFQPGGAGERLPDAGKLLVDFVLEGTLSVAVHY